MDGITTTTSDGADGEQWAAEPPITEQPQMLTTAIGDQCANCGARLAGDQRYCVECGERRGKPRYALPAIGASTAVKPARSAFATRRLAVPMSSNGTLIAGVATLLLAMGVGLLIGLSVNKAPAPSASKVVVVPSSGAAGAATTATPTTGAASTSTPGTGATGSHHATSSTSKSAAKSRAALTKALPPKLKVIPKPLQSSVKKVGQACTGGPGCTGGKFTGNFFGGG